MTDQDRAILRVCANTSVECLVGSIPLHPLTRKQIHGLRISDMIVEETEVWSEDAD
jgi:hypothetical protein